LGRTISHPQPYRPQNRRPVCHSSLGGVFFSSATETQNAYCFKIRKKRPKNANFRSKMAILTHLIYACNTYHKRGKHQSNTTHQKPSAHPPHTRKTAAKKRAQNSRKRKEEEF
jgi:hypothetical protein